MQTTPNKGIAAIALNFVNSVWLAIGMMEPPIKQQFTINSATARTGKIQLAVLM